MTIGRSLEKGAEEARIVWKGPKEIKKNKGRSIATAQACLKMTFKTQQSNLNDSIKIKLLCGIRSDAQQIVNQFSRASRVDIEAGQF